MHVTTICSNVRILTLEQIHTYMNNFLRLNLKMDINWKEDNLSPNFDNNPIFYSINDGSHTIHCVQSLRFHCLT